METGAGQAPSDAASIPEVPVLLAAAVDAIGGSGRPGQVLMAESAEAALSSGEHLAVQAGTGTGKSLAYLVPAIRHAMTERTTVVVSTATIALQRQLVDRDLPRLTEALAPLLPRRPTFAILKGRRNYLCLYRLETGAPEDPGDGLFDSRSVSATGRQVKRIHEWAAETTAGDRDELVPGVGEHAWRQVAVGGKECVGAQRCPYGTDCHAEKARERAGEADIVVTNHALLAIDALEETPVLPEHDVVVIDEAHELTARVTSAATGELTATAVAVAASRCSRMIDEDVSARLEEAGERLRELLAGAPAGRLDALPPALGDMLALIRDAAHGCVTAMGPRSGDGPGGDGAGLRRAAFAALDEVHDVSVRVLDAFTGDWDVVWLEQELGRRPATLKVAPLSVAGLLRAALFENRTAVLTSATLALGGTFDAMAREWGLPPAVTGNGETRAAREGRHEGDGGSGADGAGWTGIDVGSPFDYPRRGILYVARHLPPPGRDGLPDAYLTELEELIAAAGGRTLGLFSSMRAAQRAAEALRDRLDHPILCQGDDATALLVRQFAEDERACLLGTLSLWQGVDVPGPSLQLVVIDRIPFPRPDDPLASARQRQVERNGGNGFMTVAASHAALLLAQGAGRLLRSMDDRGVVAVLDPRLATARYSGYLRASLPPFWATSAPGKVRAALRRISGEA